MQNELVQQQMDNLQRKRAMLEFQQAAVEANKPVQHQHQHQQLMDHFSFFEEQPASTLLQLAAPVLPHLQPYLQLAQPNIHHSPEP
ncbi:unnamed protein product [Lupinus luteus]|uniref:Uncharacterized protein n=1 Tax=Lupinus luteus TaxID=3873 RepID=A0AAV1W6I4_LUPLU